MTTHASLQRCRYTVVKYAHDPMRQEPVNIAVVVWSVDDPTIMRWRFDPTMKRVVKLYPSANPRAVTAALGAFKQRAENDPSCLQSGAGGTGSLVITPARGVRCEDMEVEVEDLFDTLILPSEADTEEPREKNRSARLIKGRMNEFFKSLGVFKMVDAQKLRRVKCNSGVEHTFNFAYKNDSVHLVDTMSFDTGSSQTEQLDKARSFANLVGDVLLGHPGASKPTIEVVIQRPTESINDPNYEDALKILRTVEAEKHEVTNDKDLMEFCEKTKLHLHLGE